MGVVIHEESEGNQGQGTEYPLDKRYFNGNIYSSLHSWPVPGKIGLKHRFSAWYKTEN